MQYLQQLWQAWKWVGRLLNDVVARISLTIFYLTNFAPFGLAMTLQSRSKRQAPIQMLF